MFFKSKKLIGLDIGTANIKLAELDVSRRSATLNSFAVIPTPAGAISNGEVADPAILSDGLKGLVSDIKTKRKSAAIGLWGTSVITKRISIPPMDEKLVAGQIRWEAEQYIPYDINEVNIDFRILKKFRSSPDVMDVLLVAAKMDVAMLYQDIIQSSGLECAVIDVTGFALANTFFHNWGDQVGQTVGLMNIGATVTNFVVIDNGEVIFCRDIPVGGSTYTSEIQKGMGINADEAEAMKISACTGQAAPEEVAKIIQSTHEMFCEEVQSSIDFFVNTTPGVSLSQCFVTGGASKTTGLINRIAEQTKLNLEIFDPLKAIKVNEKNLSLQYISEVRDFASIALGLGLRMIGDS